nr:MAG TPA: hypothetical protein [Caudoviricetes sp.]
MGKNGPSETPAPTEQRADRVVRPYGKRQEMAAKMISKIGAQVGHGIYEFWARALSAGAIPFGECVPALFLFLARRDAQWARHGRSARRGSTTPPRCMPNRWCGGG